MKKQTSACSAVSAVKAITEQKGTPENDLDFHSAAVRRLTFTAFFFIQLKNALKVKMVRL